MIVQGIFAALVGFAVSAHAGVGRFDVLPEEGMEYLVLDGSGKLEALSASRGRILRLHGGSSATLRGGSVGDRERVGSVPIAVGQTRARILWRIDGPIPRLASVRLAIDGTGLVEDSLNLPLPSGTATGPVVWTSGSRSVVAVAGASLWIAPQELVETGSLAVSNWSSQPLALSARRLEVHGDTLFAGLADGRVSAWRLTATSMVDLGIFGSPLPFTGHGGAVPYGFGRAYALLDSAGVPWIHSSGWQRLPVEEPAEELAWVSGVEGVLRVRTATGAVHETFNDGYRRLLGTGSGAVGFVVDRHGRADAVELAGPVGFFGRVEAFLSRLWGAQHHEGGLGLLPLRVDPIDVSPPLTPLVLIELGASGSEAATIDWGVVSDSSASAVPVTSLGRTDLVHGPNRRTWAPGGLTSGRYWVRASVRTDSDSSFLFQRILVDGLAPAGNVSWSGTGEGGWSVEGWRLDRMHKLRLDLSGVVDQPWPDSSARVQVLFIRGTDTLRIAHNLPDTALWLDGTVGGARIPPGEWSLALRLSDRLGNARIVEGPFSVDTGDGVASVSRVRTQTFSPVATARLTPSFLDARNRHEASLRVDLVDRAGRTLHVQVRAPDGSAFRCGDRTWSDSLWTIGASGRAGATSLCRLESGVQGIVVGANTLRLVVSDGQDSLVVPVGFNVDRYQTMITSPQGEAQDTVAVRGLVSSSTLNSGFVGYRAYWAAGIVQPRPTESWDSLLASAEWKAMPVPLSNQLAELPTGWRAHSADRSFPQSNIGAQSLGSEGILGFFHPGSAVVGDYTVLVGAEARDGAVNWGVQSFRWIGASLEKAPQVELIDSNGTVLNARNADVRDDSLAWGLRADRSLDLQAIVYAGTWNDGALVQVWRRGITLDSGVVERLSWTGRDQSGRWVDSGAYTLVLDGFDPRSGRGVRLVRALTVVPPLLSADSLLRVRPGVVRWIPSVGVDPRATLSVRWDKPSAWRLDIVTPDGDSVARLVDSSRSSSYDLDWDFRLSGNRVVRASDGPRTLVARLMELPVGSGGIVSVPFRVEPDTALLDTALSAFESSDSVWSPDVTSAFRFRAKARGELLHIPVRKVDISPFATGRQWVRNWVDVPWGLDYLKFYNSLEYASEARYVLRSYEWWFTWYGSFRSTHHQNHTHAPERLQTAWAPAYERQGLLSEQDSLAAAAAWQPTDSASLHALFSAARGPVGRAYYGDLPHIGLPILETGSLDVEGSCNFPQQTCSVNCEVFPAQCTETQIERGAGDYGNWMGYLDSLRRLGRHQCAFNQTVNRSYEEQDFCAVTGVSEGVGLRGDSWKGMDDANLTLSFVGRGDASVGRNPFYSIQGTKGGNADGDKVTDLAGLVKLGAVIGEPVTGVMNGTALGSSANAPGQRYYYRMRERSVWDDDAWRHNFRLTGDREVDYSQAAFASLPRLQWKHPYLTLHGQIRGNGTGGTINFAQLRRRDVPFSDPMAWSGQLADGEWNCWRKPGATSDTCFRTFGGIKHGLRGFGFQPIASGVRGHNGQIVPMHRYVANFWSRDSGGMARWLHADPWAPGNEDNLEFEPVLDTGIAMFGVTWDTVGIGFPYGETEEAILATVDRSDDDSIHAWRSEVGVDWLPFKGDTAAYYTLRPRRGSASLVGDAYVDSVDIPLKDRFGRLLDRTELGRGPQDPWYLRVQRSSLSWNLRLRSYRMGPDGLESEPDTTGLFHDVSVFDAGGTGSVTARLRYRNKPLLMSDWSSDLDPSFRRRGGYLRGQGEFNSETFRPRDAALGNGGFLGLLDPLSLDTANASSLAPFVRVDSSGTSRADFNPNLILDQDKFHWDLELYHADGHTRNLDLDTAGLAPRFFDLQLDPRTGARRDAVLRGRIPASYSRQGVAWTFQDYSILVRRQGDSVGFESISVNPWHTVDSAGGLLGVHLPRTAADPWSADTMAVPVLAWWDVSRANGNHEVLLVARYRHPQTGEVRPALERRVVRIGQTLSTDGVVQSPYRRASLSFPAGAADPSDVVSIVPVTAAALPAQARTRGLVPIGPVLEISSTGTREFPGDKPTLAVSYGAREVYTMEGLDGFETDPLDSVLATLARVGAGWRLHVLSDNGKLDALTTTVVVTESPNPEQVVLSLSASVPHFSFALVLPDDGRDGEVPVVDTLRKTDSTLVLSGRYLDSIMPAGALLFPGLLPGDLRLSWSPDTTASYRTRRSLGALTVDAYGRFRVEIPRDQLPSEGWITLHVHYDGSRRAATVLVRMTPTVLTVWGASLDPTMIRPRCGDVVQKLRLYAAKDDSLVRRWVDSSGAILAQSVLSVREGLQSFAWDGCLEGLPLPTGLYAQQLVLPDSSQDMVLPFGVEREPWIVRAIEAHPTALVASLLDTTHAVTLRATLSSGSSTLGWGVRALDGRWLRRWTASESTSWNGRDSLGSILPPGTYRVAAWLVDSRAAAEAEVVLRDADSILVSLEALPERPIYPASAMLRTRVDRPLLGRLTLLDEDRNDLGILIDTVRSLTGVQSWTWTPKSDRALPRWAWLQVWTPDRVQTKQIEVAISMEVPPPVARIDSSSQLPDTLWEGLHGEILKALGAADRWKVRLQLPVAVHLERRVLQVGGAILSIDTVVVDPRSPTVVWMGRGRGDSLLPSGRLRVVWSALPVHTEGNATLVLDRTVWLERLPAAVVVASTDPATHSDLGDAFATRVTTVLEAAGVRARVWNVSAAAAYMRTVVGGTIVMADQVPDSSLFAGQGWNSFYEFARQGGRVAFVGESPLARRRTATGLDSTPGAILPLLGLASPYATSVEHAGQWHRWTVTTPVTRLDSSLAHELTLLSAPGARVFGSRQWILDSLQSGTGLFSEISGGTTIQQRDTLSDTLDMAATFYARPELWKTGNVGNAVLSVHPHLAGIDGTERERAAADYARLVVRYFFTDDLSVGPTSLAFEPVRRRGDSLSLRVRFSYVGDSTLDSAVVRVVGEAIGLDTALRFGPVRPGVRLDTSIVWIVPDTAQFGESRLRLRVEPWIRVLPDGDTLVEPNTSNNSWSWVLTVADTAPPVVRIDSVSGDTLRRGWSPRFEARASMHAVVTTTQHGLGKLRLDWRVETPQGMVLGRGAIPNVSAESTLTPIELAHSLPLSGHGVVRWIVTAKDRFDVVGADSAWLVIDSLPPTLDRWEVLNTSHSKSPKGWESYFRSSNQTSDTVAWSALDENGLQTIRLRRVVLESESTEPSVWSDVGVWTTSERSHELERSLSSGKWLVGLEVEDRAGNLLDTLLEIDRDNETPALRLYAIRRSRLDTLGRRDQVASDIDLKPLALQRMPENDSDLVVYTDVDSNATQMASEAVRTFDTPSRVTATRTFPMPAGNRIRLLLDAEDRSATTISVKLDGRVVPVDDLNPYLRAGGDSLLGSADAAALRRHPRQRLLDFAATAPEHQVVFTARDASGYEIEWSVWFVNSNPDLLVVDSAADGASGPDWGDVYGRQNTWTPPGKADPETWAFWLLQRRNPRAAGVADQRTTRLMVDADNDSTTGDQSSPSVRGADIALELLPGRGTDTGSSVRIRRIAYDSVTQTWTEASSEFGEGIHGLNGMAIDGNDADDPTTAMVGEGDQTLPSLVVARSTHGALEVGLRPSMIQGVQPIRWSLLTDGTGGDSVLTSNGGMILWSPKREKTVEVDGFTEEWLAHSSAQELRTFSRTRKVGDTVNVWLALENPLASPVRGMVLRYFVTATQAPIVEWGGPSAPAVPEGAVSVRVVAANTLPGLQSLDATQWAIEIQCGTCLVTGGSSLWPLGTLRLVGGGQNPADDWSYSVDSLSVNGKLPSYDLWGRRLGGSEPTTTALRLPVARIDQLGVGSLPVGSSRVLRGDRSYDPEGRTLGYQWRVESIGRIDTTVNDTVRFTQPGRYEIVLRVYDKAQPDRSGYATLQLEVVDSAGQSQRPVKVEELVLFDDQYNRRIVGTNNSSGWFQYSGDTVHVDGRPVIVRPATGNRMLGIDFRTNTGFNNVVHMELCPSSSTCNYANPVDIHRYSNLEFQFLQDPSTREPIRIWIKRINYSQIQTPGLEERYALVQSYLPGNEHTGRWQKVSIPMQELISYPTGTGGGWVIKITREGIDHGNYSIPSPRIFIDDLKLVTYETTLGLVTTRRTDVTYLDKSEDFVPEGSYARDEIRTHHRIVNHSERNIDLRNLQLKRDYLSRGSSTVDGWHFGVDQWIPVRMGGVIEPPEDPGTFDAMRHETQHSRPVESGYVRSRLTTTWDRTAPVASTAFQFPPLGTVRWSDDFRSMATGSLPGIIHFPPKYLYAMDGRSLHEGRPDPLRQWAVQPRGFLTEIVDGQERRLFGYERGEEPGQMQFWTSQKLWDPEEAIPSNKPQVRIDRTMLRSAYAQGENVVLTIDSAWDPLDRPVNLRWIDRTTGASVTGTSAQATLSEVGSHWFVAVLEVVGQSHIVGYDSVSLDVVPDDTRPYAMNRSSITGDVRGPLWATEWPWRWGGTASAYPSGPGYFVASALHDSTTPTTSTVQLPIEGTSFFVLPFRSKPGLSGTQFVHGGMDPVRVSDWTHLEFQVATEDTRPAIPLRIWLNDAAAPPTSLEEPFVYVETYVPRGGISQTWRKVSIPLEDLLAGYANDARLSSFDRIKFMLDNTGPSSNGYQGYRKNIWIDDLKLVRYADAAGRKVSTRRGSLSIAGHFNPDPLSYTGSWDIRLLNPTPKDLPLDSVRLRVVVGGNASVVRMWSLKDQHNGRPQADSIWFPSVSSSTLSSSAPDRDRLLELTWPSEAGLQLPAGTSVILRMETTVDQNWGLHWTPDSMPRLWSLPAKRAYFQMAEKVVADRLLPTGEWVRLWGLLADDDPTVIQEWTEVAFMNPNDTIVSGTQSTGVQVSLDSPSEIVYTGSGSVQSVVDGDRTVLSMPLQSAFVFDKTLTVPEGMGSMRFLKIDVKFAGQVDWSSDAQLIAINPEAGRWWDGLGHISMEPARQGWTTLSFPFNPDLYPAGTEMTLKFFVNAGGPGQVLLDNLRASP